MVGVGVGDVGEETRVNAANDPWPWNRQTTTHESTESTESTPENENENESESKDENTTGRQNNMIPAHSQSDAFSTNKVV